MQVDGLKGSHVESGGKSFPVKTVLAVPAGSANVDLDDSGPGQGRRAKQREVYGDYANALHKLSEHVMHLEYVTHTSVRATDKKVDDLTMSMQAQVVGVNASIQECVTATSH